MLCIIANNSREKRSEPTGPNESSYSIEFSLLGIEFAFQFKLLDTSPRGLSILVNGKSRVLEELRVGDVLHMKVYKPDTRCAIPQGYLKTETRHITKKGNGSYVLGFMILQIVKSRPVRRGILSLKNQPMVGTLRFFS